MELRNALKWVAKLGSFKPWDDKATFTVVLSIMDRNNRPCARSPGTARWWTTTRNPAGRAATVIAEAALPRDFYRADPREVAPKLLGKRLCRRLGGEILAGKIVEVEAYLSAGDFAAHHQRPRSKATESLYGEPGTCYVYQLRQHFLVNVVAVDGAILFRAIEPTLRRRHHEEEPRHRGRSSSPAGPGRLCQALGISRALDMA